MVAVRAGSSIKTTSLKETGMFNAVKRNGEQSTLPAPVKGINDIDAWHGMKDDYAVLMENWWPEPSKLVTRKGCLTRNSGFDAPVKTIVEYAHQDGSYKIFAASGGAIYDITASGEIGRASGRESVG